MRSIDGSISPINVTPKMPPVVWLECGFVVQLLAGTAKALQCFLGSPQHTVSKEQLHAEVFADEATGLDAVEVLIYRLRKKIEAAAAASGSSSEVVITTFRGMGYMLTSPSGSA